MANTSMPGEQDMSVPQVDNNFSSKSGDGDGKFIRPPAFYDAWQKSEGIPIYKAYHIDDMNEVELAPWKRRGEGPRSCAFTMSPLPVRRSRFLRRCDKIAQSCRELFSALMASVGGPIRRP